MTDIESAIFDLPRWINILRSVHHNEELDETDRHEALTLALDGLYHWTCELRETYRQAK